MRIKTIGNISYAHRHNIQAIDANEIEVECDSAEQIGKVNSINGLCMNCFEFNDATRDALREVRFVRCNEMRHDVLLARARVIMRHLGRLMTDVSIAESGI